jgi:Mrp family chromosome partitioning ATPase
MHWLDMGRDAGAFSGLDPEAPDLKRARPLDLLCNALALHKTGLTAGLIAAPLAVALFLMAAPLQYRAVARLAAPVADAANAGAVLAGEARLIASREFGRRTIKALDIDARPEFDSLSAGAGPIGGALVFLGLTPDPARISRDERILQAYEDRLSVSRSETGLDIAFRSRDRAFAATAANRIAALYLDLRGKPAKAGDPDAPAVMAAMISPAVQPVRPLLPARRLMFEIAAGAAVLAALGFGAMRRPPRRRPEIEAPMEPPRAVGDAPVFVRLADPPRTLSQAGQNAASKRFADEDADLLDKVAARIIAGRRETGALRIVGAGLAPGAAASALMLTLARRLGNEGRSILVRLDDADGAADALAFSGEPGVRDLIAASSSFAEAIRRDPRSRLHVIPAGPRRAPDDLPLEPGPIEADELGGVLDALARTYDFIWLLAPALDASDIARTLAAQSDFFVIAAPSKPQGGAIARAEAELRATGARDILVIGAPLPAARSLGQDAA